MLLLKELTWNNRLKNQQDLTQVLENVFAKRPEERRCFKALFLPRYWNPEDGTQTSAGPVRRRQEGYMNKHLNMAADVEFDLIQVYKIYFLSYKKIWRSQHLPSDSEVLTIGVFGGLVSAEGGEEEVMEAWKLYRRMSVLDFPSARLRKPLPFQFRGQSSYTRPGGASEMSWLERGEGDGPEREVHEEVTEEVGCNKSSLHSYSLVSLVVGLDSYSTKNSSLGNRAQS